MGPGPDTPAPPLNQLAVKPRDSRHEERMTRREEQGRYQMLWDCPACGAGGLLGLDHRFCPSCGAAQDPARRYFPSDDQKIAVQDHPYHGADKVCPACDTPNAAVSEFCQACGSPLDDAKAASVRADRVAAAGDAFAADSARDAAAEANARRQAAEAARLDELGGAPPRARKSGRSMAAVGCFAAIGLLLFAVAMFCLLSSLWARIDQVEVVRHTWERQIPVEAFGPVQGTAWRESVPIGARDLTCSREEKGTERVPDGEDCRMRRQDKGDGTFTEVRECEPRFREEPTYGERCRFTVDDWRVVRTERADGSDLGPRWPEIALRAGEREAARAATYTIVVLDGKGAQHTCGLDEATWRSYPVGARVEARFGGLTGLIDCASLRR
jgi:hypothetical protein